MRPFILLRAGSGVKVIGGGFGRTGTASLKVALEELGFGPCYHMTEVFANPEHADFWLAAWRGEPVDWDGVLEATRRPWTGRPALSTPSLWRDTQMRRCS